MAKASLAAVSLAFLAVLGPFCARKGPLTPIGLAQMLIRFRTKNFRSLKERQELSFVASSLKDAKGVHIRTSEELGFDLLRVIAIYGANASGKTNVLRALQFMSAAVEDSHRVWQPKEPVPLQPFALDRESQTAPSTFAVDLLLDGVRYDYGFTLEKQRVRKEWLYAFPKGRRQVWFKRDFEAPDVFYFGKNLVGEKSTIQSLTRDNSLFLSAAAQNNHEQLTPIFKWFSENLIHLGPGHRGSLAPATARYCKKLNAEKYLLAMLGGADLGIVDLELADAEANGNTGGSKDASNSPPKAGGDRSRSDLDRHGVSMRHRAAEDPRGVAFPFNEESNGTKALFGLLGPIIHALATGGMLSIDELDSSLHPNLALELVRSFNDADRNTNNAQLVFNTHDSNLLDREILGRDQIWFAEKDSGGATHIYPLSDFKPRRHETLGRGYLQGRYGAVPYIGSENFVAPDPVEPAVGDAAS